MISNFKEEKIELIELKGYNREEVAILMNAVDLVLMTSFSEGSPQFIKEAIVCNTPIVSTNVGDVWGVIKDTKGCYITKENPSDIKSKIEKILEYDARTNGREHIMQMDNIRIAGKIINVYDDILNMENDYMILTKNNSKQN